jgi:potassium-transporting ATPase KdpC subunit
MLRRQLPTALSMLLVLTALTGLAYPMAVSGVAQTVFHDKAEGSLVERGGRVVGSRLIGQPFNRPEYFHPRPSKAGDGYDAADSSGSNAGPTNKEFLATVRARANAYRDENVLAEGRPVPVDAVTASASGLDPDISVANARDQATRVARARGMALIAVLRLIDRHTTSRSLGFLGERTVNVLEINLALDQR